MATSPGCDSMSKLVEIFSRHQQLRRQQQQIKQLQLELQQLRLQNENMRQGMRRCASCEYRIDFKQRQGNNKSPD
jgi:hypothetical protein